VHSTKSTVSCAVQLALTVLQYAGFAEDSFVQYSSNACFCTVPCVSLLQAANILYLDQPTGTEFSYKEDVHIVLLCS